MQHDMTRLVSEHADQLMRDHQMDRGDADDTNTARAWAHEDLLTDALTIWARWFYDATLSGQIVDAIRARVDDIARDVSAQVVATYPASPGRKGREH